MSDPRRRCLHARPRPRPATPGHARPCLVDEGGTVLVLMPVAALIVVLLGAVAVDLSMAFAGTRRAADLAASWANTAAQQIDASAYYADEGTVTYVDSDLVAAVETAWLRERDREHGLALDRPLVRLVEGPDGPSVEVEVSGEVPLIFLDAFPGVGGPRRVAAVSRARLVIG